MQASGDFPFFICLSLSFLIIMPSFTFVVLSFFSRGKGHTHETCFSHGKDAQTYFPLILLSASVHLHCFLRASASECRSSEAVFFTAHCFIKVHIALVRQFLALPLLYFCIHSWRLKEINYIQISTLSYKYGASRSLHGQVLEKCRKTRRIP